MRKIGIVLALFAVVSLYAEECQYCYGKGSVKITVEEKDPFRSKPRTEKVRCPDCGGSRRETADEMEWKELPMLWGESIQAVNNEYRWSRRSNTLQTSFRMGGKLKFNVVYLFEDNKLVKIVLTRTITNQLYEHEEWEYEFNEVSKGLSTLINGQTTANFYGGSGGNKIIEEKRKPSIWSDKYILDGTQTPTRITQGKTWDGMHQLKAEMKCWCDKRKRTTTLQVTIIPIAK